ncbi:MAG TPA: ATP-binding protein, partial [Bacteroidia bacterium]|nr:ATP-binding protein [Bacteroidia bacterium]
MERKVIERTAQLEKNIQQLRESEEKFQKAFQGSAAGISITHLSDASYLEINDAFVQMTGYSREELMNHTSVELGLIVNFKKREEILEQVRKHGSAKSFEMTVRHKSGKLLEVLSSVDTIVLGNEKYAINIIYDITERKQAEEQLQLVNKELEAFSYSVSHDLRAPLRAVNGYAEMLSEDYGPQLDEEGKRILQAIKYNAAKMGMLIDDLLSFSRLGRKELQKTSIDMNELVEGVMIEIGKSITHRAEIKIGKLHKTKADYGLLHQVMFNLISNAIKYSSKEKNPVVEINSKEKSGEIVFSVKDNGAGFDMKYYDKLFGVFQRLHTQEEFEGTGVGLAIVQRIISKHRGKIWAEGKINEGAAFYFTL